jgi:hypothetical protein
MTARTLDAGALKTGVPPLDFYRTELPNMPAPRRDYGWVSAGLCIFHPDTHAGNFRVNLDTGGFCCFACGCKGADIISFTQTRHGLSFPDAMKAIAETWGNTR